MNRQSLVRTLQGLRFLHDVDRRHLDALADVAQLRHYDELQVVFREAAPADRVYLVAAGNVSLEICAPGIGCRRILTVGPGELLGWSGLLEDARMTATARTLEPTQLVEIDAARLRAIAAENLAFGNELFRRAMLALTKRLSATRMQLVDVYGSHLPAAANELEA